MRSPLLPAKRLPPAVWFIVLGPLVFSALLYAAVGTTASPRQIWRNLAITYFHFIFYAGGYWLWGIPLRRYPGLAGWPASFLRFLLASFSGSGAALGLLVLLGWKAPEEFLLSMPRSLGVGMTVMFVSLFIERLYGQLLRSRQEATRRAIEKEKALRLAAEAQWNSLESRVRPHFLFNTLSSIRELIHQDPLQAEQMIERLADLLRSSLDAPRHCLSHLEDELAIVDNYLTIEHMRLGPRLRWTVDCADTVRDCLLPSLSLLTLVENSVKHAISPSRHGGEIRVTARRQGEHVELRVRDSGTGFDLNQCPPGHGIDLLQRRLETVFGGAASLDVEPGGGVVLRCPYRVGLPAPKGIG